MMYNDLTPYERALARFGDKCALIAGLEIADKMSPEDAYQQIRASTNYFICFWLCP
jgi:hypothetical protein